MISSFILDRLIHFRSKKFMRRGNNQVSSWRRGRGGPGIPALASAPIAFNRGGPGEKRKA